jgi:hypothetical protein
MLNDDWIHLLITHDNGQVAAFLAAGRLTHRDAAASAVGLEMGPAHGEIRLEISVSLGNARSSEWAVAQVQA